MTTRTLDINAMGLTSLNETDMVEINGGNIFKAIGSAIASAAEWTWNNIEKVGAAVGLVVSAIDLADK